MTTNSSFYKRWTELETIQPCAAKKGKTYTEIHLKEETLVLRHIPRHCAEALANYFRTTVDQSRKLSQDLLPKGTQRNPPLVLFSELTLVGVKFRKRTRLTNESGGIGYVVLEQIERLYGVDGGKKTRITFKSGNEVVLPQRYRSVHLACQRAWKIKELYAEEKKRLFAEK